MQSVSGNNVGSTLYIPNKSLHINLFHCPKKITLGRKIPVKLSFDYPAVRYNEARKQQTLAGFFVPSSEFYSLGNISINAGSPLAG